MDERQRPARGEAAAEAESGRDESTHEELSF
jgi:hypothetical protein